MKQNNHKELYTALGEGKTIQAKNRDGDWYDVKLELNEWLDYRIKPEQKPDIEYFAEAFMLSTSKRPLMNECRYPNIKLTFDGETGKLKSAEVLK